MEAEAAKFIGAGLATLGMIGAGIGVGTIFSGFLQGALRNPSAASGQFTNLVLGFALTEARGILAFVLGLLILFS
jgi:F-type H+-transporting ATPase subunit c